MCVLAADADEEEFVVIVRYCGRDVLNRTVSGRTGCRLCYDQSHIVERLDDFLPNEFGQAVSTIEHSTSDDLITSYRLDASCRCCS